MCLILDVGTLRAAAKTRLESSIKKFKPNLVHDLFLHQATKATTKRTRKPTASGPIVTTPLGYHSP